MHMYKSKLKAISEYTHQPKHYVYHPENTAKLEKVTVHSLQFFSA